MDLKGSKTEDNLKAAFAGESQANRRYLYFAAKADVEGYNDVAAVFRSTAEGETGHAHGHLDYMKKVGDPGTDMPISDVEEMLKDRAEEEAKKAIREKLFGDDEEPPAEGEEPQEEKDLEDQLKDEAKKRLKDLLGGG